MAAIYEPRRLPAHPSPRPAPRPALRLVTADGGHSAIVPVELGLRAVHLVAAVGLLLVVLIGSLAIGNGALAGLAPAPGTPSGAAAAVDGPVVRVQAGDTLWTIARRLQPTGDVRPLVDRLVAANGTAPLQVGDEVVVPR